MRLRHPCWLGLHYLSLACLHLFCFHLHIMLQQLRYTDHASAVCQDIRSFVVPQESTLLAGQKCTWRASGSLLHKPHDRLPQGRVLQSGPW